MKGSVKIMLSYDYCHFEVALSSDEDMDMKGVNALRKKAQRLADEAVRQYKKAKDMAAKRSNAEWERHNFLSQVKQIQEKPEQDRTVRELAILKQYQDEEWEAQYAYEYDYEDDEDFEEE